MSSETNLERCLKCQSAGKTIVPAGNILIWPRADKATIESVKQAYALSEVLTLENIVNDLIQWDSPIYREFLVERADWCSQLFTEFGSNN